MASSASDAANALVARHSKSKQSVDFIFSLAFHIEDPTGSGDALSNIGHVVLLRPNRAPFLTSFKKVPDVLCNTTAHWSELLDHRDAEP